MGQRQLTKLRQLLQAAPESLQGSRLRLFPVLKLDCISQGKFQFWGNALKCLSRALLVILLCALFILLPLTLAYAIPSASNAVPSPSSQPTSHARCLGRFPHGSDTSLYGLPQNLPRHYVSQQSSSKKMLF